LGPDFADLLGVTGAGEVFEFVGESLHIGIFGNLTVYYHAGSGDIVYVGIKVTDVLGAKTAAAG
jgi:hypothetical protein